MIFSTSLRKTLLISALGHITIFSIFSFSFGYKIPKVDYVEVSFWGGILRPSDLRPSPRLYKETINSQHYKTRGIKENFIQKSYKEDPWVYGYYLKPTAFLGTQDDKQIVLHQKPSLAFPKNRKIPTVMFYPFLPQHFLIYFKDRQLAHIELMFNIISGQKINPIIIKRKISSGNLEADLLTMRYISHYLFVQQAAFPSNNWQTVKIELSPKHDKY